MPLCGEERAKRSLKKTRQKLQFSALIYFTICLDSLLIIIIMIIVKITFKDNIKTCGQVQKLHLQLYNKSNKNHSFGRKFSLADEKNIYMCSLLSSLVSTNKICTRWIG